MTTLFNFLKEHPFIGTIIILNLIDAVKSIIVAVCITLRSHQNHVNNDIDA
jgi:hypothetical protein